MTAPGLAATFWSACAEGRLRLPCCARCGRLRWYLLARCPHCTHDAYDWADLSGAAALYSYSVVHRAFTDSGPAVPYLVALVLPAEDPGVRIVTRLVDYTPADLTDGRPLQLVFVDEGDRRLPLFRPA